MATFPKVGDPIPATIGQCADLLHDTQTLRLAMKAEYDAVEAREKELKTHIIDSCTVDQGGVGLRYRCEVKSEPTPIIEDWAAFTAAIAAANRFDLIHKRVSTDAIKELWAAGAQVPGIGLMIQKKVSLTKIGK